VCAIEIIVMDDVEYFGSDLLCGLRFEGFELSLGWGFTHFSLP